MLTYTSAAATRFGRRRDSISDFAFCEIVSSDTEILQFDSNGTTDSPILAAAADGFGQNRVGGIAAAAGVQAIADAFRSMSNKFESSKVAMYEAVLSANKSVNAATSQFPGIGGTIASALICGRHLAVTNLGNSGAGIVRNGKFEFLTDEHTVLSRTDEAAKPGLSKTLSRFVGMYDESTPVDLPIYDDVTLSGGETVFLCNSTLRSALSDSEISEILTKSAPAKKRVELLLSAAAEVIDDDDLTAIIIDIGGGSPKGGFFGKLRQNNKAFYISLFVLVFAAGVFVSTLIQTAFSPKANNPVDATPTPTEQSTSTPVQSFDPNKVSSMTPPPSQPGGDSSGKITDTTPNRTAVPQNTGDSRVNPGGGTGVATAPPAPRPTYPVGETKPPIDEPRPTPTDEPKPTPPVDVPNPTPTDEPKPTPTDEPKPTPTDEPKPTPTDEPKPTPAPTPEPTAEPTPEPTPVPFETFGPGF